MDSPNVFIAIPCYGAMPLKTVESLLRLERELLSFPHTICFKPGQSVVSTSRNELAAYFLAGTWTHLVFIDSDMVFTPAQIVRLLAHNEPIVSGVCARKNAKTSFCFSGYGSIGQRDLLEVQLVGMGFISISREVFERMIEAIGPEIEYTTTDPESGESRTKWDFYSVGVRLRGGKRRHFAEDYYFCERAREIGYKIYVDRRVIPGHIGQAIYPVCDKWQAERVRESEWCERWYERELEQSA